MRLSLKQIVVAGVATISLAGLASTGALAASTRDCKLYGICDYQQGYTNYNDPAGTEQPVQPTRRTRAKAASEPAFQIKEETGISGPHGVGW